MLFKIYYVSEWIMVSKAECITAMRNKFSKYGPLTNIRADVWETKNSKVYLCSWLRTKVVRFTRFRLRVIKGSQVGDDKIVHQTLTGTKCYVATRACRPMERPKSIIVWKMTRHNDHLYHDMGIYEIHQVGDFPSAASKSTRLVFLSTTE